MYGSEEDWSRGIVFFMFTLSNKSLVYWELCASVEVVVDEFVTARRE